MHRLFLMRQRSEATGIGRQLQLLVQWDLFGLTNSKFDPGKGRARPPSPRAGNSAG